MRTTRSKAPTTAFVLLGLVLGAKAVPSVNVAVKTSFGAPPYLVELLETAADENATSYFPLLDRIADGYFDSSKNDKDLYTKFRKILQTDGHLTRSEDLSSFDLALSIHSTAPRIEAHFQYYNTAVLPTLGEDNGDSCESWIHVPFAGRRYCSADLSEQNAHLLGKTGDTVNTVPFDRVLGTPGSGKPSILYADVTSSSFRHLHKSMSKTAKAGKSSYRVRYKPSRDASERSLPVSGYGVELALKRTDYIVIDDREQETAEIEGTVKPQDATLNEDEVSDLRPLSQSELRRLGVKAASFVLASDKPLDTLLKLSQDFPKHSSSMASTNISEEFLKEHHANRDVILPPGFNVLWINGVQIMGRDVDAYSLLEHLRRERKMINSVRELGLSGLEAVNLLSHAAVTASQTNEEVQRYDWRDETEGGKVIMWLNDIEKDKRYAEWPSTVTAFLQRMYPGQLPPVRRELHNLVMPIDFSDFADVSTVVENIQSFVKRKVPVRFGLVPVLRSPAGVEQARTVYHLLETYGLAAALDYLGQSINGSGRKYKSSQPQYFEKALVDRSARGERPALSLEEVLKDGGLSERIKAAQAYYSRLGASGGSTPILVNGVAIPKTEDWLQMMSQRVGLDSRVVQEAVYLEKVGEEDYLPDLFLVDASSRRNPTMVPEDDKEARHINVGELPFDELPSLAHNPETIESELVQLTIAADLNTAEGVELVLEATFFQRNHDNVEVALLHRPGAAPSHRTLLSEVGNPHGTKLLEALQYQYGMKVASEVITGDGPTYAQRQAIYKALYQEVQDVPMDVGHGWKSWTFAQSIVAAAGIQPGEKAIILNGRVVGPVDFSSALNADDLEALLAYERKKRLLPAAAAIKDLGLKKQASTPLAFARVSNLIALSLVSDIPEGIFEAAPTVRSSVFKQWNSTHTAIKIGDEKSATIHIVASIDPASELAQRWIPMIKVLSELEGVYTCLYLNPKDRMDELPIKRFYRYVLDSKPTFGSNGAVNELSARFDGLPAEALLNMGMDLPPSWLVAPKESIHDLDNIKLSAVKSGSDIEASYELENILIEGHSTDVTLGPPPRGAQLVLGTNLDPHFADTIIMANLGYFQFKANPGVYNLTLQKGRSEEIFNIDSAGTSGAKLDAKDSNTEIALMSFRGVTLFPKLSRKPNMEDEDVLEASKSAVENLADHADKLLAQAGIGGTHAGKYLSKAAKFGSSLISSGGKLTDVSAEGHAEINIFSVASGHLYERMLNIMMLSVMKHTQHTVKFWFIEQFLSPSFKTFLPTLAKEYGFKYEMVTYKWPHWLRGQKEKQREIWGYKILFLDVLFPLDLDKVIFVDADQIVRTDMYELVQHDLNGAPYGFTPMCDSRTEMEGFRFWKQGYWKNFLRGKNYHISALYVVDLKKFRQIAAGDRLRGQYHQLSADPASLSNLDQDLPNHMQMVLPIHSLPQEWLWCETWCSDEALKEAKTIDLCNNPQTKEPKLDRARRQVPEWTVYDDEIAAVARREKEGDVAGGRPVAGVADEGGPQAVEEESIQERLQREDAERERKRVRDEL